MTADFLAKMDLFYIEEEDRSSGIGVLADNSPGPFSIGDKMSIFGCTTLVYGTELVLLPTQTAFTPGDPIRPTGTNNRSSGGGVFGNQPGVFHDLSVPGAPRPAYGLNDVGSLIRLWGRVTCDNLELDLPWGPSQVFWIDDGTNLHDGFNCATGSPSTGVAVLLPPDTPPPSGYWGITGIMTAVPSLSWLPVRLLVPRSEDDMTPYQSRGRSAQDGALQGVGKGAL